MSIEKIIKIRDESGLGLKSAQKVLEESNGELKRALECVKEEGKRIAFQRTAKLTKASTIGYYVHGDQKIVAMVEIACESDLTASADFFNQFANKIAMHIAAAQCTYLNRNEIPKEILNEIPSEDLEDFYMQNCLLEQPYICNESISISDLILEFIYKHKENVEIKRFSYYKSRRDI